MNIKIACIAALVGLLPIVTFAELPPSAYESMQAKAPEKLTIEVLKVEVEPGDVPTKQKVSVVAIVSSVDQTANNVKVDDIINIDYTVESHPKGFVGPGEIPILAEKDKTIAYLAPTESGNYTPAAGRMSFSKF